MLQERMTTESRHSVSEQGFWSPRNEAETPELVADRSLFAQSQAAL